MTTEMFEGKKFNKLIQKIEEKHQDKYKIINQRQIKRNSLFFWLKKYEIEIELLTEENTQQQIQQLQKHAHLNQQGIHTSTENFEEKRKKILDMLEKKEEKGINYPTNEAKKAEMMEKIMQEMLTTVEKKEQQKNETVGFLQSKEEAMLRTYYDRLLDAEVNPSIAENLIQLVKDDLDAKDWQHEESG